MAAKKFTWEIKKDQNFKLLCTWLWEKEIRSKETDQEKKGNRNGIQNIYKWTPFSKLRKNHQKFQRISEKKHKNLSDTNRNSRMKETDKELIRRREKGEAFVEEDVFFWVVEWKWKKKITADGVCFCFSI